MDLLTYIGDINSHIAIYENQRSREEIVKTLATSMLVISLSIPLFLVVWHVECIYISTVHTY